MINENVKFFTCLMLLEFVSNICAQKTTVTFCGVTNPEHLSVELDSVSISNYFTGEDTTVYGPMELTFVNPTSVEYHKHNVSPEPQTGPITPNLSIYTLHGRKVFTSLYSSTSMNSASHLRRNEPFSIQVFIEKKDGFQRKIVAIGNERFGVRVI